MKLAEWQKTQIYNENMCVDDWEWVPCINHVLRILGYVDSLCHDENYETVKWTSNKPQIKDKNIRESIRTWAKINGATELKYFEGENCLEDIFRNEIHFNQALGLEDAKTYTTEELCGEVEE